MPNLPYALAPEANAAPLMHDQADMYQAPFAGVPYQQPFTPSLSGYPAAGQSAADMPQPYMPDFFPYGQQGFSGYPVDAQQWPGQPEAQPPYASEAGGPLQTYATPYANPYSFTGVTPETAPHAGAGMEDDQGRSGNDRSGSKEPSKPAKKESSVRGSSKLKQERSPLQAFIERQRGRQYYEEPRDSRPWINL